jgi:hypothetical protein
VDPTRVARTLADRGPIGGSLAAILLATAWVATWRPQVDPDAWWHIGLGDRVLATGAIPVVETFSWLTAGERIVVHSWLWDVLLASAHRAAGAFGTSVLILPVTAVIVGLLWFLLGSGTLGLPPAGRAGLVLAASVAAVAAWAPRAQTLDVAFVLAGVVVLDRYLRTGDRRPLLALPVIGLLWANLHGSAILALPLTIGLAVVALPIGRRLGDWPPRTPLPLLAAGSGALFAACLNPYGAGLWLYPFDRSVASAFIPEIIEWRPLDPTAPGSIPFIVLLAATGALLLLRRERRPDAFLLLTTLAWAVAAVSSARFVAIASCLLAVALGAALARRVAGGDGSRVTPAVPSSPAPRPPAWTSVVAPLAILVVGTTLIAPAAQDAAIRHRLPVAAVEALIAGTCPGRSLVDYGWAGYVGWATGREVGAYGNSPEAAVRSQVAVELGRVDPGPWLDDHAVEVALLPTGGPLSRWLDGASGWMVAYRDDQATIHGRRGDCSVAA